MNIVQHNSTVFQESRIWDCLFLTLPKIETDSGAITSINGTHEIPFLPKRVYYLYDVPGGSERGGHAHRDLYQLIVAAGGSFDVLIDDGNMKKTISLNRPYHGLLVVPGIWRELMNFSSGATCLVLASEVYDADDYIRDFDVLIQLKNNKYNEV
jgi:dTDP-4-dehydrorhamnose 3,5-epimerase-like enzyme